MEEQKDIKFAEEIQKMEYEPMDKTELKLVRWSLSLGIGLLVVLFLISKFLLPPGTH